MSGAFIQKHTTATKADAIVENLVRDGEQTGATRKFYAERAIERAVADKREYDAEIIRRVNNMSPALTAEQLDELRLRRSELEAEAGQASNEAAIRSAMLKRLLSIGLTLEQISDHISSKLTPAEMLVLGANMDKLGEAASPADLRAEVVKFLVEHNPKGLGSVGQDPKDFTEELVRNVLAGDRRGMTTSTSPPSETRGDIDRKAAVAQARLDDVSRNKHKEYFISPKTVANVIAASALLSGAAYVGGKRSIDATLRGVREGAAIAAARDDNARNQAVLGALAPPRRDEQQGPPPAAPLSPRLGASSFEGAILDPSILDEGPSLQQRVIRRRAPFPRERARLESTPERAQRGVATRQARVVRKPATRVQRATVEPSSQVISAQRGVTASPQQIEKDIRDIVSGPQSPSRNTITALKSGLRKGNVGERLEAKAERISGMLSELIDIGRAAGLSESGRNDPLSIAIRHQKELSESRGGRLSVVMPEQVKPRLDIALAQIGAGNSSKQLRRDAMQLISHQHDMGAISANKARQLSRMVMHAS